MKSVVLVVLVMAVSAALAEKQPFERYQSIIDRQMFGPLPPGFDPTANPNDVRKTSSAEEKQLTQEQEKLQSSIHFSVINVTPEGDAAVGFTDNSDPKAPVHYYLKVGEKRNGWEVKEADPAAATMTIAKGDIEVSLSLGGNSAKDAGATSKSGAGAASAGEAPQRPGGGRGLLGGGSLRSRRMMRERQEQEAKAKADAAAAAKEAERQAQEAERQAQADADKAQRDAERAEQRQQLMAIQEELKRVRAAKAAEAKPEGESGSGDNEDN